MKQPKYKGKELLPLSVIDAARNGDAQAVDSVLRYYEGYINKLAVDANDEVIGYQFVKLGKMMEDIRHGKTPNEAYEKNVGTYGRFSKEQGAVKYIDPREE